MPGSEDLHLHDLRHTWASRMAMAGVGLLTIKELSGWKTIQMVQRYAHLSPDHKRQALERLSGNFTICSQNGGGSSGPDKCQETSGEAEGIGDSIRALS